MKKPASTGGRPASAPIDARTAGDWRGEILARMRRLIHEAVPDVVEESKWGGTPVWSRDGILCTGETYQSVVKLTFAKGATLSDPAKLFNSSLDGNMRRAIDIREGESVDAASFRALVRAAAELNATGGKGTSMRKAKVPKAGRAKPAAKKSGMGGRSAAARRKSPARTGKPVLLSGGNPQIAMGHGDAPVQAYIAAMPDWKRGIGRRLDALITRAVPDVRKAVKWNSPFYGIEGRGWFLGLHVFTRYVKVMFFQGTSLQPVPPGGKQKEARWIDIHEDDLDEAQMASWVRQAAALPGWLTTDIRGT